MSYRRLRAQFFTREKDVFLFSIRLRHEKCNKIVFQPKGSLIWFPLMIYGQIFCLVSLSSFHNYFCYWSVSRTVLATVSRASIIHGQEKEDVQYVTWIHKYSRQHAVHKYTKAVYSKRFRRWCGFQTLYKEDLSDKRRFIVTVFILVYFIFKIKIF